MTGLHEVESTLIVVSAEPDRVAAEVAALTTLGDLSLRERVDETINDTYFDLRDRSLSARKTAIRVREAHGSTLLTLKIDTGPSGDVADRIEIEAAWSREALSRVVAELARLGVPMREAGIRSGLPAREALAELGFEAIQERETRRTPRDAVPKEGGDPLAEMAVDRVCFFLPDGVVRHHEIEVEAKGHGTAQDVERAVTRLREAFRSELRSWPYGKLATGIALKVLLADGEWARFVDRDGTLRASAYEGIEAILGSDRA